MIKVDLIPFMRCSKCRRPAILYQRYSGLHLCRNHFVTDFETKAKRAIRTHHWLSPGDTIAVALSGGRSSAALLYFLRSLLSGRRDIRLLALTVDEGILEYRDPAESVRIAGELGVPHTSVSFYEEFGTNIDRINLSRGNDPCSYCRVLRHCLLETTARNLGATRLALGHNLDDEAANLFLRAVRGDCARLPPGSGTLEPTIPWIKPFIYLPEREVALYFHLHLDRVSGQRCPHGNHALMNDVRRWLNEYSWNHPSTRYALVNLGEELHGPAGDGADRDRVACEWSGKSCKGEFRSYPGCRLLTVTGKEHCNDI
ncbi:MAG: tRNA(Ile)-lysidine synthase [Methanolinea sp.]|nr:tRNA(Ile)-lysidine synthase [Methanolinea sp.]